MIEIDRSDSEALGWYLYSFAMAMKIAVPECKADGAKRGRHGDSLPGVEHLKVVPR